MDGLLQLSCSYVFYLCSGTANEKLNGLEKAIELL
ncbi:hypothetical protein IMSAGC004_02288 [Bacteroidaceae bacterium]|nr:hypothetical protein IMSAGC004_02288 [Bacteroidaceae bacterium]